MFYFAHMTIEELRVKIAIGRYHGIAKDIQKKTGLSLPTIRKYMSGEIYQPNAIKVLKTAYQLVHEKERGSI